VSVSLATGEMPDRITSCAAPTDASPNERDIIADFFADEVSVLPTFHLYFSTRAALAFFLSRRILSFNPGSKGGRATEPIC
jgi:hypothetical protein